MHELFRRSIEASLSEDAGFASREEEALRLSNELVRSYLELCLQQMADRQEERLRITRQTSEGEENVEVYRRHEDGAETYHALCGPLEVKRATYRVQLPRNGPTVVPLELAAGLVEGLTPALAKSIAWATSS